MRTFDKAAHTYDDVTKLHRQLADQLVNDLGDVSPLRIVDMGCGTGYLTTVLKNRFPKAHVTGVDIAPSMIQLASVKGEHINWVIADARQLLNELKGFDLIISNGAYQWITPLEESLSNAHRQMVSGGLFAANIFGYETCCELIDAFDKAGISVMKRLPKQDDISKAITMAGFQDIKISSRILKETFKEPVDLLRWLKAMGANRLDQHQMIGKERFNQALAKYPRRSDGAIDATIEVITIKAKA